MANQYTKLSRDNIITKMNRKKNPVTSAVDMAREFGYNVVYTRRSGLRAGHKDVRAPQTFEHRVVALVGRQVWNQLRNDEFVNLAYR